MDYSTIINRILKEKKEVERTSGDLQTWRDWYSGKPTAFHRYSIYNGKKTIRRTRLSMRMAKQCAEDWASLLMNEKVQIGVSKQDLLDKLLIDIDFYNKANKSVEYAFGLSMAGLTVELENLELDLKQDENDENKYVGEIKSTEKTKVSCGVYSALKVIPLTYENGEWVECAFIQENTTNTKITIHLRDENKNYNIVIVEISKDTGKTTKRYELNTNSKYPLFVVVHPQIVNNIDLDSNKPIPIFANAIDTLKAIDATYDSYVNEFILGRKRIFVSSDINRVNKDTGEVEFNFDPNDTVFQALPKDTALMQSGNGNPYVFVSNDALRSAEHSQAIQDQLNFFSKQVGLGVDYYRFEKGRVMTATQVISEKSDTFRNLKKHEGVFEKALTTFIRGLMSAYNDYVISNEKFDNIDEVKIVFDDSIVEDKTTEKANDQKDVEFGALSLVKYRMKWYAETEEEAQKYVKKIYGDADFLKRLTNFTPFLTQGVLTAKEFVKNVYLDIKGENEQQALADEISKNLKSSSEVFDTSNIYNPALSE